MRIFKEIREKYIKVGVSELSGIIGESRQKIYHYEKHTDIPAIKHLVALKQIAGQKLSWAKLGKMLEDELTD